MSAPGRVPSNDPLAPKSPLLRVAHRLAQLPAVTWFLVNVGSRLDPTLMRLSGGRLNTTGTQHVVVLRHRGKKTGLLRETPLVYFTHGDDVVLIASNGGAPTHPAWFHNVCGHADVELHVGERGGPYRAHVATGEERARLWRLATSLFAGYERYRERAGGREIPLVVCTPVSQAGS